MTKHGEKYPHMINVLKLFNAASDELKTFEEDLHQHVHLENNILFPMAKNKIYSSGSQ